MKQIERVYISLALWGLEISERPDDAELGKWTRELHKNLVLGKKGKDSFADKLISEVEETRTEWNNRKNKFKETKEKDSAPSAPGGAGNEGENPETPAVKIDPAEIEFESFRVAFPGTRAGHDSALKIFKNVVGKSWREVIPKLLPAVELEKEWHKKCDDVGAWHQPWAMLTTWIRQRRWEQEFTEPVAPPVSKRAQPKTFAQIEEEEREQSYRDAQARLDAYGK